MPMKRIIRKLWTISNIFGKCRKSGFDTGAAASIYTMDDIVFSLTISRLAASFGTGRNLTFYGCKGRITMHATPSIPSRSFKGTELPT